MSTRGFFTFVGGPDEEYHVYKHSDCYPSGGIRAIHGACAFAWTLPRFEADEFAAAFVAWTKIPWALATSVERIMELARGRTDISSPNSHSSVDMMVPVPCPRYLENSGGGVRLYQSGDWRDVAPPDIAYRYVVFSRRGQVFIQVFEVGHDGSDNRDGWTEQSLFVGTIANALAWVAAQEEAPAPTLPTPRTRGRNARS
jgi:hypothetical protein